MSLLSRLILGAIAIAILIAAVSSAITGLWVKSGIDASNKAQAARLHRAQVSGCYRQNIRTVALNKNALATWEEDTLFAGAVAKPQAHATAKERKLTSDFHDRLENEIATLTFTPVVLDCAQAPTTVELPVAFSSLPRDRHGNIVGPPSVDLKLTRATAGPYLTVSR